MGYQILPLEALAYVKVGKRFSRDELRVSECRCPRKFAEPLSADDCLMYLHSMLVPLCRVFASIPLYEQTLELSKQYNYSWYDSLIIAAALEAQCTVLYSEDFQDVIE